MRRAPLPAGRAPPAPRPPPPRAVQTPRSLDVDAAALVDALANRSQQQPSPAVVDAGRALVADVAATRAPPSPACARAIDTVAGTLARAWRNGTDPRASLERDARTLRCVAACGHASLAARDLTAALMGACGRALADDAIAEGRGRLLATLPAASAAVRAATCLGYGPPAALLDALTASLALGVGAPFGSGGAAAPPAAVVDLLCAAAASRHALPPAAALALAEARFTPVQAATAAAALASLAAPPPPRLVSLLRVRVAGARAGMPPPAAAAAAVALATWHALDGPSAASLLDACSAGLDGPAALPAGDWVCVHAALSTVGASTLPPLTPRAGRGRATARDAAAAHCADCVVAGPPPELVALAEAAGLEVREPSETSRLKFFLTFKRTHPPSVPPLTLGPPSSNSPIVPLRNLAMPEAACVTAEAAAAAAATRGGSGVTVVTTEGVLRLA